MDDLSATSRAKRGPRLPTVLSVPETAALLGALRGTTWLMAAPIYGGGLRVTECCQLRLKDVDFHQGLLVVRSGKGDKDRTTLLADMCREPLRAQLRAAEAIHPILAPKAPKFRGRSLLTGTRRMPHAAAGCVSRAVERFRHGATQLKAV